MDETLKRIKAALQKTNLPPELKVAEIGVARQLFGKNPDKMGAWADWLGANPNATEGETLRKDHEPAGIPKPTRPYTPIDEDVPQEIDW